MNLANRITMVRFFLIPVFILTYFFPGLSQPWAALVFILASLTDLADGYIARSRNMVTTFGKFMDPLMDKLLTMTAFVLLAGSQKIPALLVVIIVGRELTITALRSLAASRGKIIAASWWGKYKTTFQMITLVLLLFEDNWLPFFSQSFLRPLLLGITLLLTLVSAMDYLWKNRDVIDLENI